MHEWVMPTAMRMGPVGLRVRDIHSLERFYRSVVGLEVREADSEHVLLGTEERSLIDLLHDPNVPRRPTSAAGLFHIAIRVPSRAALGGVLRRIEDAGSLNGASDHGVSEALYVSDPEGNGIEVYRDRPRSEWPNRNGRLVITTDPLDLDGVRVDGESADTVPRDTDIGHIHLEVTNLDKSMRFYRDALGMNERYAVAGAHFLAAGTYHHHLAINVWNRRNTSHQGAGIEWFTICLPPREREILFEHMEVPASNPTLTDPDGMHVRIEAETNM